MGIIDYIKSLKRKREAIRYKQQAYNRSWLEVASAIDKIKKLEE